MYAIYKIALISVLFHISIYNCIFFSIMQSFYLVFIMSPSRFLSPFALSSQCNNHINWPLLFKIPKNLRPAG